MTSGGAKQIAKAALVVMFAFVLSRVLGLAREMIISSHFGTSGELDAYLAAFRIPDILFQVVAGGALGSAFLPTFTTHLAQDDEAGAWRLASAIINLVILILCSLALLGAIFAPLARPLRRRARFRSGPPGADRRADALHDDLHRALRRQRRGHGHP